MTFSNPKDFEDVTVVEVYEVAITEYADHRELVASHLFTDIEKAKRYAAEVAYELNCVEVSVESYSSALLSYEDKHDDMNVTVCKSSIYS